MGDRNTKIKMFDTQMYLKGLRGGRWYDEEDQGFHEGLGPTVPQGLVGSSILEALR